MTLSKSNTKQQECIHHWIIDTPHGQTSYGKCKHCGAVAEFSNTWLNDLVGREKTVISAPGMKADNLPGVSSRLN
jgi:hypothetical protein